MVVKKTGEQKCGSFSSYIKEGPVTDMPAHLDTEKAGLALFVTGDTLGKGSEELGGILMRNLFASLEQNERLPQFIIFMNKGVFLSCEGSIVLEHLINFEKQGVEILTSKTCLEYYQIRHKLCVGIATNMYTILGKLSLVEKILTI
ncbi:MAG: sulfurtransferase-like selenium metabolism protein YedF [Bacillota bacterium]|jgi:selenium metabolism protein YedF